MYEYSKWLVLMETEDDRFVMHKAFDGYKDAKSYARSIVGKLSVHGKIATAIVYENRNYFIDEEVLD